jgi:hypothetical protein
MTKKLLTILTLIFLASCTSQYAEEMKKTGKAGAASGRINASDSNSQDMLKELDKKD